MYFSKSLNGFNLFNVMVHLRWTCRARSELNTFFFLDSIRVALYDSRFTIILIYLILGLGPASRFILCLTWEYTLCRHWDVFQKHLCSDAEIRSMEAKGSASKTLLVWSEAKQTMELQQHRPKPSVSPERDDHIKGHLLLLTP